MKTAQICPMIALAVLSVLVPATEVQAARPRAHRCTVVIESVDVTNRTIRAASIGGHNKSVALYWTKSTRFQSSASPISPADLSVGQNVSVVHRQPFIGPWRLEMLFSTR
jgi:hypothetical protein